jgi:hypothetical protein
LPTSTITVSVMYADPKKPKGILKHAFRPRQLNDLDFERRRYTQPPWPLTGDWDGCSYGLRLCMDACPEFEKEMSLLQVKHWRVLLESQSPY